MGIQTKGGMSVPKRNKRCTGLDDAHYVFQSKVLPALFLPDKALLYFPSWNIIHCGHIKLSSVLGLAVTISPMSNLD